MIDSRQSFFFLGNIGNATKKNSHYLCALFQQIVTANFIALITLKNKNNYRCLYVPEL